MSGIRPEGTYPVSDEFGTNVTCRGGRTTSVDRVRPEGANHDQSDAINPQQTTSMIAEPAPTCHASEAIFLKRRVLPRCMDSRDRIKQRRSIA